MPYEHLISSSQATEAFKEDVRRYLSGVQAERIALARHSPRIKVARLIAQLLSVEATLEIQDIVVDGWSGCSDFKGRVVVTTPDGTKVFRFLWDCSWRAEQEGWYDPFHLPDQIRAARMFDWRCFSQWEEHFIEDGTVPAVSPPHERVSPR
jgi:hypothetical protein